MFIIVTLSRNIVSYIICIVYFLCKIIITIKSNKLIYCSDIDSVIGVYGIMFINYYSIKANYDMLFLDSELY